MKMLGNRKGEKMSKFSKIMLSILGAGVSLFAGTFVIYFFNLDMKLLSAIEPIFLKHYDKIPRNQYL
jgi:hypothetical protein